MAWLAVAGLVAIVVRLGVPNPAELLVDVAERPATWIAANVVLIVMPLAFGVARPLLVGSAARTTPPWPSLVSALVVVAAAALAGSGVFHGVFGAHLASHVDDGSPGADLVMLAELTHALGDTCWFIGVAALMAITAASVLAGRPALPPPPTTVAAGLRWCGALSVAANLGQFGWFFDHRFGMLAAPGTLLQSVWLVGTGAAAVRGTRAPA